MVYLKSPEEIELIGESGKILRDLFSELGSLLQDGMSTAWLDRWIEDYIRDCQAVPAFKGYRGYPNASCVSINEQVVHGIPSERPLHAGDIVSVDVGVKLSGYVTDAARTFAVGDISAEAARLMEVTERALELGIAQARPGNRVGAIGAAVQDWVERHGYSVVRALHGHGVGYFLHEDPAIPNFGQARRGTLLKDGMVLAIEPMVNAGDAEVEVLSDNWTVVTRDRRLSAHFENTVAIVHGQPRILTA
jgi:methionyl aminopeptidase